MHLGDTNLKTFRTRIFSLILGIFMLVAVLSGCTLIVPNKTEAMSKESLKIGNTVLTKAHHLQY